MAENRTKYWLAAAALALGAQPVAAQVDEADRLARCQNNRDALARLEATRANYVTEEQIEAGRTALVAMRGIEAEINRNVTNMDAIFDGPERRRLVAANIALDARIVAWGASVNFHCPSGQPACVISLPFRLAAAIDAAVVQLPQARQFLRQVEVHNNNLIALRCDQGDSAAGRTIALDAAGVPNFAGAWADIDGRVFYISQSGDRVTMTVNIFGQEQSAEGNFSDGMLNMRWMAGNPPRMQQGSGTVISGADGVAREIRFPNGFHYVRQ